MTLGCLERAHRELTIAFGLVAGLVVGGCGGNGPTSGIGMGPAATEIFCPDGKAQDICVGGAFVHCAANGTHSVTQNCLADGLSCFPSYGCAVCVPGSRSCDGDTPTACRADGSGYDPGTECEGTADSQCNVRTGECENLCETAENGSSYIGCDYWAVTATNAVANEFEYAVVVTNPQSVEATVEITRGSKSVESVEVAPLGVKTIRLPWVASLKNARTASVLERGGAYHVQSSVPVTVYQFSPLEFQIDRDCANENEDEASDDNCFSFSNDASLLFPTHVLTGNYRGLSMSGQLTSQSVTNLDTNKVVSEDSLDSPAFIAIVGASEGPTELSFRTPAFIRDLDGGDELDGGDAGEVANFDDLEPNSTASMTLDQGDVLELLTGKPPAVCTPPEEHPSDEQSGNCRAEDGSIFPCTATLDYCHLGNEYDLTGLEIRSEGRVAVVAGHHCAFVPEYRYACDHLEDAILPLEAWGMRYIVTPPVALRGEPSVVRVLAQKDDTKVTFSTDADAVTLDEGEYFDFETADPVMIEGTEPILVAQFLVGQDYFGLGSGGGTSEGDPDMGLAIPVEQYRDQYAFLVPTTYTDSYVGIIAELQDDVLVDNKPLTGWKKIGDTRYKTVHVRLEAGAHEATSTNPFGLMVYGYALYTSYLYPGGLDFHPINPIL